MTTGSPVICRSGIWVTRPMTRRFSSMHWAANIPPWSSTEPGPVHDLFEFLANEETRHMQQLEKLYCEIYLVEESEAGVRP